MLNFVEFSERPVNSRQGGRHTNFEFSRIGVILAKYIQISYKKSFTTTFKACI